MRLKNDSRGFTLIELLITVAIMLSILIISITSITGLSGRKGDEAYNRVVDEIKTAAEQYVSANEYKFISSGEAKIPVELLIDSGYLNKVVNPKTRKVIPKCSYVVINKGEKNGKIYLKTGEFTTSNDGSCGLQIHKGNIDGNITSVFKCVNDDNTLVTTVSTAEDTDNWYNKKSLTKNNKDCYLAANLKVKYDTSVNSVLKVYKSDGTSSVLATYTGTGESKFKEAEVYDKTTFKSDGEIKVTYALEYYDTERSSASLDVEAKIDTVAPTVPTVGLYKFVKNSDSPVSKEGLANYDTGSWSNLKVFTEAKSSDETSGIAGYKYTTTGTTTNQAEAPGSWRRIMANGKSTIKYMACDKARNCSNYSAVQNVMIDKTAPTLNATLYKFKKNSEDPTSSSGLKEYTSGDWSNRYVLASASASDSLSGIDKDGVTYTVTGTTSAQAGTKGNMKTIKSEGTSTIKYKVCDVAGNCSETGAQTIKIDTQKPNATVSLTSGDGKSINSGSHAHYKNMKYRITASDEKKNNSKSGIKEIKYIVENGLKTNKTFNDYKKTISSGTEDWLLDFAGKKTVYAVAIDNAGNIGYAYAEGILDNDTVVVNHGKQQCNFTLTFSLRYDHVDGQIADGFQYAVWNVESTSDTTNKQSGDVAKKCGSAPPDNATFNKVSGNESKQISILTKNKSKAYYCFAVRPRKKASKYVPKYDDLKWTVQRKHAMSSSCQ